MQTSARFSSCVKLHFIFIAGVLLSLQANADSFKFRFRNTSKSTLAIFYKDIRKDGSYKTKAIFKLASGEQKDKEISVSKNDTLAFYGQSTEGENSVYIRRDYSYLKQQKLPVWIIPIVIPEKLNTRFESLEGLGLQLEHNKVLNFLLKLDSTSMSSLTLLENNFQNVYPLGTFIFVDTKTNRLLIPPLEPSFWAGSENYLTIQDSLYTLINNERRGQANVQLAYFVAKLFDSLRVSNTAELEFKGQLSLIRWKPGPTANIYQVFNDKSVQAFMQNCFAQINEPDVQFRRYRLYFVSSYERIDNLQISGKKFYSFGNETDASVQGQLFSTDLGIMFSKNNVFSNYFSIQNAVLRTKAYDFTSMLFNAFKNNTRNKILTDTYANQHEITEAIVGEYNNLVAYNPNPQGLNLVKLSKDDVSSSLVPVITTVNNLTPYAPAPLDTSRQAAASGSAEKAETYNNRVKLYNSHLKQLNVLIKQLDQTNADIAKLSQQDNSKAFPAGNPSVMLNEMEVSNAIVRKD